MIPPIIALIFLVASLGCFYYLFRGFTADDNPMLGNILATGVNAVLCAFFVSWFINGAIADTSIVENRTFCVDYNGMTSSQISSIQQQFGARSYVLDSDGAGMFTAKAIDDPVLTLAGMENLTVTYSTHDVIYVQYQERSLGYFFLFLALLNGALFLWFVFSAGWPAISQFIHGSKPAAGEKV